MSANAGGFQRNASFFRVITAPVGTIGKRRPYLLAWVVVSVGSLFFCTSALALPTAFKTAVELTAREQPIDHFLEEVFGHTGIPVQIAPDVKGYVNGQFSKTADAVVDDILGSFQLSMYYDGAVVYIYPANNVSRVILPISGKTSKRLIASAIELGLLDTQNTLSPSTNGGLVVTGARRFVEQIEELSHAVQQNMPSRRSPSATYRVFRLKYAWAHDVKLAVGGQEVRVPGVASILQSLINPGVLDAPSPDPSVTGSTIPGLRGKGLLASSEGQTPDGALVEAVPNVHAQVTGRSIGSDNSHDTRIVADSRLNAVIIRDLAERMPMYQGLIDSLDIEPVMLEIEATIIDMDTDRLRELGVNWRLQDGENEVLLGNGTSSDIALQPGASVTPQGQGGIVSLVLGDQTRFISRVRALETQGAARIVSKPHVITLSDVEAILDTTSTFFVRVAGQEEVDLFNVSVGTTLRVTPHVFEVSGQSRIKLLVSIEDGSASEQQVDGIPIIDRSTINTQALIDGGESLLVGGLVREFTGNATSKVPLLGSIPGLGALFRTNTRTSSRVERLFLITPRLVRQSGESRTFGEPVLAGDEADIVRSAPNRTSHTVAALAGRDAQFPVVPELPGGAAQITLDTPVLTNRPLLDKPAATGRETVAQPSIRERLLRIPRQGRESPVREAMWEDGDGWVAVPGTDVTGQTSEHSEPHTANPDVPGLSSANDGWQEISQ